jgi:hypothetical protein
VKEIILTQGQITLVDDEDYEELNKLKWFVVKNKGVYYAARKINLHGMRRILFMHRVIMQTPEGFYTDHINHNSLDNRRCNLRQCTIAENQHNQRIRTSTKTSKYKGVCRYKTSKKWRAQITINGKRITIGYFEKEIDAALAYNNSAIQYFGNYATLNQLEDKLSRG